MLRFLTYLLFNIIGVFAAGDLTAIVTTTTGPVQGEILRTGPNSLPYAAFKGIKYGKAPVGYLRFKPPVPVDPWTSTLNATIEGSSCPQIDRAANAVVGSEDCLFLNVLTPVTSRGIIPRGLKAVMVWIHGGGFVSGSGSTQTQRPDYLLEKGIVFVSINYRLGALGFLSLNHPNATGNAGLKDQNLALKWIKSNIRKFGGNPNNITIFGVSAGAASVGYHVLSDVSTGLFHGAISNSGVPLAPWAFQTPTKAVSLAERLGTLIGTNSTNKETLLEAFYAATSAQLVTATIPIGLIVAFTPTIENASITSEPFLTESPYRKYYTGKYNKVSELLGFMDQETISFTVALPSFLEVINYALDEATIDGIEPPESLVTIQNLILAGGNLSQVDPNTVQAAVNISSELLFISAIDRTQKFLAADNDEYPVYYYHVSFYTDRTGHSLFYPGSIPGAGHQDDVVYIFYIPAANYSTDPNDPVARTIDSVTTMWTNFAKYGNPTPHWIHNRCEDVIWPDSGSCGYALDIGYELVVDPRPINDDTALIELLSWPDEKESLGIQGLIRPA